jgi:hypothetical protein
MCNSIVKPASPAASEGSQGSKDIAVTETYNWLINAGVPFSAFDPVAIEPTPIASSDLYGCVDEITSLFSPPSAQKQSPSPMCSSYGLASPSSLDSPVVEHSFGINGEDASLELPQEMLGELNTAIWGL